MAFEIPRDLMVSVSGVRGRVGEALTPEVVTRFATAFGAYLSKQIGGRAKVVIARDSRTSGPMFVRAATAALQSVGCDVIDAGLAPTPTALFTIRHHQAQGGIVVTASHNPVEWNALKLASGSGMFLDADEAAGMRAFLDERAVTWAAWDRLGSVSSDTAAVQRHLNAVLSVPFVNAAALRERRFKVALDCVHGAGSVLLPPLLDALGCEVVALGMEPDGRFPREPEPIAANLGDLERLVREEKADLGIATDPDADRVSLVSNTGKAIGEDFTLALAAALVLKHRPGPVVTNLSTSRLLEDVAAAYGAAVVRAPVGEVNVARRMQDDRGQVISATQANLLVRIGGAWVTPMLDGCGVAGVMRRAFREWSAGRGAPVPERPLSVAEVGAAEALILTNALHGARPVASLDGRPLAPDPLAREFHGWLDRQ